ncbi:hypothetical protein AMJ80_05990 [bacterium SM23_31]|nr:MAG: hypothetical protein AMJ80_05990 [bacterium SM23_31]
MYTLIRENGSISFIMLCGIEKFILTCTIKKGTLNSAYLKRFAVHCRYSEQELYAGIFISAYYNTSLTDTLLYYAGYNLFGWYIIFIPVLTELCGYI